MAQAVVEERQLLKTLRWYDGFALALANPGFLLGSLGYSVLDLGGWGAAMLWGVTAFLIVFVMVLYSELAAMFPNKSGGFPLYANEGWRKYTTLVGPIATFGYWLGWSVVLAFLGLFVGSIAQAQWWPRRALRHERVRRCRDRRRLFQHLARQRPHRAPASDRDRGHPVRLGVELLRGAPRGHVQLPGRHPPDDPALRLHGPAVPERRLRLGEPDVQAERCRTRLGRLGR